MSVSDTDVTPPDLAEVLAAHRPLPDHWVGGSQAHCSCKWAGPRHHFDGTPPDIVDAEHAAHQAQAWRDACTITTVEDLDRVSAGAIVQSAAGSIACRFDGRNGVVFGDDRPFPWHKLALPALLIPQWA